MNELATRRRVLIVGDSMLVATFLEEAFELLGIAVVGPVGTVDDALRLAHAGDFDFAVLDINLHDELAFPVADVLVARGTPFFFSSGYSAATIMPERYRDTPLLPKPYEIDALNEMIGRTIARIDVSSGGTRVGNS